MAGLGAPKGNQYAVGHKGGDGRGTLQNELLRKKQAEKDWFGEHDFEKLMRQVKGRYRSPHKIWLAKLLTGNDAALKEAYKRLFPESLFIHQDGNVDHTITHEFIVRRQDPRTLGDAGSTLASP